MFILKKPAAAFKLLDEAEKLEKDEGLKTSLGISVFKNVMKLRIKNLDKKLYKELEEQYSTLKKRLYLAKFMNV